MVNALTSTELVVNMCWSEKPVPVGDVQASLPGKADACATTSIRIIGGVRQIQTIKSKN